jgi:hypothetical protein
MVKSDADRTGKGIKVFTIESAEGAEKAGRE